MNQSDFFKIYFQGAENMPSTVSVHVPFFGKLVLTSNCSKETVDQRDHETHFDSEYCPMSGYVYCYF